MDNYKRKFFIHSSKAILALGIGLGLPSTLRSAGPKSWLKLANRLNADGKLEVKKLIGKAQINANYLENALAYTGNNAFYVYPNSQVILSLPDKSLIWAADDTRFDLYCTNDYGSAISIYKGRIQLISNDQYHRFYPKLIHSKNSDYGLRSGALFTQISTSEQIPYSKEYTCLCHGQADIVRADLARTLQSFSAKHHNSFFLRQRGDYAVAPLGFHSDALIQEILSQAGSDIQASWLLS